MRGWRGGDGHIKREHITSSRHGFSPLEPPLAGRVLGCRNERRMQATITERRSVLRSDGEHRLLHSATKDATAKEKILQRHPRIGLFNAGDPAETIVTKPIRNYKGPETSP